MLRLARLKPRCIAASMVLGLSSAAMTSPAGAAAMLYLDLPGIAGSVAVPGFGNLIPINHIELESGRFDVSKAVDVSTPALFAAAVVGEHFADAEILYSPSFPDVVPAPYLLFNGLVAVGQSISSTDPFLEDDGFAFSSVTVVPPGAPSGVAEPSPLLVLSTGVGLMAAAGRRRRPPSGPMEPAPTA